MTSKVEDAASAGDPGPTTSARRGHRVHLLTLVLVVTAGFLLVEVVGRLHELPAPRQIPWWVLIPLFCAAEVFVVHIQFRRDAHSVSLNEIPLVLALAFATPGHLLVAHQFIEPRTACSRHDGADQARFLTAFWAYSAHVY